MACGAKTAKSESWINVDLGSPLLNVKTMNILEGLNFPSNYFDGVYSAQFVEHLEIDQLRKVFCEVHRVLKPGGIFRVVTPNLEELAKTYLFYKKQLDKKQSSYDETYYDWIRIEIFDQISRDFTGGQQKQLFDNPSPDLQKILIERFGSLMLSRRKLQGKAAPTKLQKALSLKWRIPIVVFKKILNLLLHSIMPKEFWIGKFRKSGEVHRYLHDSFSLKREFSGAGFTNFKVLDPFKSGIPNWDTYELDVSGSISDAPKSLFVEGQKNIDDSRK